MRFLWRWFKRLVLVTVIMIFGLLAPVGYTEVMCRPSGSPTAYAAIIDPAFHRPETRTLMTYPEWHIVHAYEDYGRILDDGDPHDYGFLAGIAGFWGSLCALSQASGPHGQIDGPTKRMVYVIGVSFTAELLLKAAYEETIGRAFAAVRGPERAVLDSVSALQAQAYAKFLQQVPWYKWDFRKDAQALTDERGVTVRDREREIALGIEYRAKAAYAQVIAAAVAQVGADELTLRMVVTGTTAKALARFEGVDVIGETGTGLEISTFRYRALTHLIQDMASAGADFVEIAGNDDIMYTVLSSSAHLPKAIYSRARQGFGDHRHLVLTAVKDLGDDLRAFDTSAVRLEHIHDY